jgi:DNA-directed RNA polymerase specialized sigma24 family protein
MEGSFIEENTILSRVDMDRILRSYRKLNEALTVSRSHFSADVVNLDETAVLAEMYSLRAMILSANDPKERLLLYHYYVKGQTLETCAKLLGISKRSVCRLKNRALENLIIKSQKS